MNETIASMISHSIKSLIKLDWELPEVLQQTSLINNIPYPLTNVPYKSNVINKQFKPTYVVGAVQLL